VLGALPIFFAGNIGLLVTAASRRPTKSLRVTALVAGLVGLSGTLLFLQRLYFGLGMGGMERVAAWPLLIFLAVAGITFIRWRGGASR
jgi:Ni/Fe-hydrogenase subunit HybB-like protein